MRFLFSFFFFFIHFSRNLITMLSRLIFYLFHPYYSILRAERDRLVVEEMNLKQELERESEEIVREKNYLENLTHVSTADQSDRGLDKEGVTRRNIVENMDDENVLAYPHDAKSSHARKLESADDNKNENIVIDSKIPSDTTSVDLERTRLEEIERMEKEELLAVARAEEVKREEAREGAAKNVLQWVQTLSEPFEEELKVVEEEESLGADSWGSDKEVSFS